MMWRQLVGLFGVWTLPTAVWSSPVAPSNDIVQIDGLTVEPDSVHNIHLRLHEAFEGELTVFFAACYASHLDDRHHIVSTSHIKRDAHPDRLIWLVPENIFHGGCLHAFADSSIIGSSTPILVTNKLRKRESIADVADPLGPWFDGVAYMKSKNVSATFAAEAKSKKVAIVGGGMSGLLTSLLLQSVGVKDWHIIESSQRVGGRIRTKYLNNTRPDQYQYQEMGPMRFPVSVYYKDTNETLDIQDHKMVFQLCETLNKMNAHDPDLAVNFIEWIQSSPNVPANSNGYRLENGRIPSRAELAADSDLALPAAASDDPDAAEAAEERFENFFNMMPDEMRNMSQNIYKAHKKAVEDGFFHWSEAAYFRYLLKTSENITDYVAGADNSPLWDFDTLYFSATKWRTIDQGLEKMPLAFMPHIEGKVTFGRKVEGLTYDNETDTVNVDWRDDPFAQTPKGETYDYAVVAVPFSKVRLWRMPSYSSSLSRAINTMNYQQSCKVSLLYKTRFWEHLDPPIIGGCGSTDLPGIGSVCYPSYAINSTGPGVILASYQSGTLCRSAAALSDADHVGLVQRAMVEVHGEVAAEQYTGIYERQCWESDEHQAGAWAAPFVGQQDLYLPAYYQTEFKTIFIGEHTSYTHAWIFSALDSAVRGTAQLLLDMGLVDEAKEVVNKWMGRWISI
jgi:monoamine oxidase